MEEHQKIIVMVAFLMMVISGLFYEEIVMLARNRFMDKAKNDIMNCTIADYTIRINF